MNKRVQLRVLKEIRSAMRFDKAIHPDRKRSSPPDLHFLNCKIAHVRDHHQALKQRVTSVGLTMIMYSSVDCVSGLYTTLVTLFGMADEADEYQFVGCVQTTNYGSMRRTSCRAKFRCGRWMVIAAGGIERDSAALYAPEHATCHDVLPLCAFGSARLRVTRHLIRTPHGAYNVKGQLRFPILTPSL